MAFAVVAAPVADAASSKPTPKPTVKISTKVVPQKGTPAPKKTSSIKPTAKASVKPRAKASAQATTAQKATPKTTQKRGASPAKSATAKSKSATNKAASTSAKKPVKKVVRKKVRVSPSPKPKWPPAGFYTDKASDDDVYARIPSSKELIGVISAKASLSQRIAECEKFACGAVQVASYIGCSWWEVTSTLYETQSDKSRKAVGDLRTLVGKSAPQQILTILLISQESVAPGQIIDNISVSCHRDTPTEDFPQYSYTPIASTSDSTTKN